MTTARGRLLGPVLACLLSSCLLLACGEVAPHRIATPAWQALSLSGLAPGFRAGVYDLKRNSLWILTDRLGASGPHSIVTLARFDIPTSSMIPTSISMNGDHWIKGSIALDANSNLWLAWGNTILKYDPSTGALQTFPLPSFEAVARVDLSTSSGRLVALAIGGDGEVWIAAADVEGLFGFDPSSGRWNRTIPLPLLPTIATRLVLSGQNVLANGAPLGATNLQSVLFEVDSNAATVVTLPVSAVDYALMPNGSIAFVDGSGSAGTLDLATGASRATASDLPVASQPDLSVDRAGRVWFSMLGFRSVGIGSLDVSSGVVTRYPFPYILDPGAPLVDDCPTHAYDCVPSNAVFDPEIQAVVVDASDDVWVLTRVAGSVTSSTAPSAVYKFSSQSTT